MTPGATLTENTGLIGHVSAVDPPFWAAVNARRCLELPTDLGGGDNSDEVAVYEALARANSVAGDDS